MAKHLDSARIFKKAYYNKKESADLYVVGTLAGFAAHTSINESARNAQAAGSAFGLIGAIASAAATSGMKSNYDYEIKYNAIVVYDKAGNSVYQIPELVSSENREIGAVTSCGEIFHLINSDLKAHNQKLADKIASELPEAVNRLNK